MVACELDKDVSGEILGWKLPAWQALLLHRVLPACGGLVIYITLICFDFALIFEHFLNGDEGLGVFCTIVMVLPALISFIFTLASPPLGLQTELSAFSITIEKKEIRWLVVQFANVLFFPIAAIGRYCYLIFWWVEAVCASRAEDKERTHEAVLKARAHSPLELYLFLQAFLHAAPHAVANILQMMKLYQATTYDRVSVQAVSIVTSTLRMASTATIYRRFEREKLCGKQYPWSNDSETLISSTDNHKVEKANENNEADNVSEIFVKKRSITSEKCDDNKIIANSDLIQFSPRNTIGTSSSLFDNDSAHYSDTSSDYEPPTSRTQHNHTPGFDSDDEYVRPITIIDRVAPRRRDTEYTIENMHIPPPPAMPAPRPGSIAVWAEKLVENAESIPTWLSAPPRRKYCDEVVHDEPDVPYRVPRAYMRGLEPQDATAALVHYLGWYTFFVARLLSIACFINFSPFFATIILFIHYQVMLLFLIIPQASTVRRGFYLFLAFIYLFCLMEFKIRFRHVRVWHVFWIIVCTAEIIIFVGVWASTDNNIQDWWRVFIVQVIIGGMTLSFMCFLVYFVLLKPKETIVYIKK